MRRSKSNRWWTSLLVLMLGIAGLLGTPASGRADGGKLSSDGSDPGSIGGGGPTSSGDPDTPTNSGKPLRPSATGGVEKYQPPAAEVPQLGESLWVVRLRVALQVLRTYYLRF